MRKITLVLAILATVAGCDIDMSTYRVRLYSSDGKVIREWRAITCRSDDCLVYIRTSPGREEVAISGTVTVEPEGPAITPEKP